MRGDGRKATAVIRLMGRRHAFLVAALAAGIWHAALAADAPREAVVYAQLLGTLPVDAAIAVEPRDDSDENLTLRDLMVARLTDRRQRVAADAPLLLRFSSTVVTNRDGAPTGGAGTGRGGRGGGRGLGGMAMGLATNGSGKSPGGTPAPTGAGVRHKLTAALEQRDGGKVLWKAEVTSAPGETDERSLPGRLASALVDAFGRSVDTRRVAGDGTPPANPR